MAKTNINSLVCCSSLFMLWKNFEKIAKKIPRTEPFILSIHTWINFQHIIESKTKMNVFDDKMNKHDGKKIAFM